MAVEMQTHTTEYYGHQVHPVKKGIARGVLRLNPSSIRYNRLVDNDEISYYCRLLDL